MRLTKEKAALNRQAIVDAAGRLFRERGFDAVSVADLMDAAGFTHGGFYNHFSSKDDLAREVTAAAIARSNAGLPRDADPKALGAYVARYLTTQHRDDRAAGCTISALAADAGRQGQEVQGSFAEGIEGLLEVFAARLIAAKGSKGKRAQAVARADAMRVCSEMVGALVLARAVAQSSPSLSDAILDASRRGCVAVLDGDE